MQRMSLVNTCGDTVCFLANKEGVWTTQVEIHFESSQAWEGFNIQKLIYILCPRWYGMGSVNMSWDAFYIFDGMGRIWPTNVEIHLVYSLALQGFGQHNYWYNLCLLWHGSSTQVQIHLLSSLKGWRLVKRSFGTFCQLDGIRWFGQRILRCILCDRFYGRCLVNTCWYTFCASMAWFGHHKLRYILCPRWHGMGLPTQVDIHFVSSLTWEGFGERMLRCNLWPH